MTNSKAIKPVEQILSDADKKCYVLIISRYFPQSQPRAGMLTWFFENMGEGEKIHTIRGNYDLWKKRINEVNEGKAYISRRYWSGKPYNSKQIEYDRLYKAGIQSIDIIQHSSKQTDGHYYATFYTQIDGRHPGVEIGAIAVNDGLTKANFKHWFFPNYKKNNIFKNGAIIHFTDFRY